MNLIKKITTALQERPTYLFQYGRGWILFHIAQFMGRFLINRERLILGSNVRFQSIRNFLTPSAESRIRIGTDTILYENARLEAHGAAVLQVGAQSIIGDTRIFCRSQIQIGDRFLSSWNTLIQDYDPHPISVALRAEQMREMTFHFLPRFAPAFNFTASPELKNWNPPSEEIHIGNDVWMGANSVILKGSRIGNGCIIAAGSVVTGGEFPDRSLIAGNPARWVKELPK